MRKRSFLKIAFLIIAAHCFSAPAFALTLNLDYVVTGSTPVGLSPWLFADIEQAGPNEVSLAMKATNLAAGSGQFVSEWFFNVASGNVVLDPTSLGTVEENQLKSFSFSPEGNAGDGQGIISGFNIAFSFNTANAEGGAQRFDAGEIFSVDLLGTGLTPESFLVANKKGEYFSAAHVQGIPGGLSGKIADPASVPEPRTMLLLGIGLTGLAFVARRKFIK